MSHSPSFFPPLHSSSLCAFSFHLCLLPPQVYVFVFSLIVVAQQSQPFLPRRQQSAWGGKDELLYKSQGVRECAVCLTSKNKFEFSGSLNVNISIAQLIVIFEGTGAEF